MLRLSTFEMAATYAPSSSLNLQGIRVLPFPPSVIVC
jgi:hypothetical protein